MAELKDEARCLPLRIDDGGSVVVLKDEARCLPLGIDDGGGCGGVEG